MYVHTYSNNNNNNNNNNNIVVALLLRINKIKDFSDVIQNLKNIYPKNYNLS